MKKSVQVLALTACAVLSLNMAACSLVAVNEEKDMKQVVATVNKTEILKSDYIAQYDAYLQYYQYFGMDPTADAEQLKEFQTMILDGLIEQEVRIQAAEVAGLDKLTEEEEAALEQEYQETIESYIEQYKTYAQQTLGEGLDDATYAEEAERLLDEDLAASEMTREALKEDLRVSNMLEKQQDDFYASIEVSEEEVRAWYDNEKTEQEAAIAQDPTTFETADPQIVAPDGYFYVKHILIQEDEETATKITEIQTTMGELEQLAGQQLLQEGMATEEATPETTPEATNATDETLTEVTTEATPAATVEATTETATEDNAEEADETNETTAEPTPDISTMTAAEQKEYYAQLNAQLQDLQSDALNKAEEVLEKIQSGEDFNFLITQYNSDPGMESNPDGYLVGPNTSTYEEAFHTAAMELKAVGDVSGIVETTYGYHIIKRVSDVQAGVIAQYEEIKDTCKEMALSEKQQEKWAEQLEAWVNDANIKRYEDRLTDNRANYTS